LEDRATTRSSMAGQATGELAQSQALRQTTVVVSGGVGVLEDGSREAVLRWAAVIIRRQLRPEAEEEDDERG
jgi:hypothetical protein